MSSGKECLIVEAEDWSVSEETWKNGRRCEERIKKKVRKATDINLKATINRRKILRNRLKLERNRVSTI